MRILENRFQANSIQWQVVQMYTSRELYDCLLKLRLRAHRSLLILKICTMDHALKNPLL